MAKISVFFFCVIVALAAMSWSVEVNRGRLDAAKRQAEKDATLIAALMRQLSRDQTQLQADGKTLTDVKGTLERQSDLIERQADTIKRQMALLERQAAVDGPRIH